MELKIGSLVRIKLIGEAREIQGVLIGERKEIEPHFATAVYVLDSTDSCKLLNEYSIGRQSVRLVSPLDKSIHSFGSDVWLKLIHVNLYNRIVNNNKIYLIDYENLSPITNNDGKVILLNHEMLEVIVGIDDELNRKIVPYESVYSVDDELYSVGA